MTPTVFTVIVGLTFGTIGLLILRERVKYPSGHSKTSKRLLSRASQHIHLGAWEEAEKILLPLIQRGIKDRELALLYAQVLRGMQKRKRALRLVRRFSREFPEELHFRLEEGRLLLELGEAEEALSALKVCAPILRSESDLIELASAYYAAGHHERSQEVIDAFLPHSQNGRVLALAGDLSFERKEFQRAIDFYSMALDHGWKTQDLVLQLAHAYRRLGNLAEAEKIFHGLLDKDNGDVEATLGLGACLQERGHYQKALLIYQAGAAWDFGDGRILKQAALCALHSEKPRYAEIYLAELHQTEAPTAQTMAYLGYAFESQGRWGEASRVYFSAIDQFPSDPHAYRALAWLYGVGLGPNLSSKEGLSCAHVALKLLPDAISWEILSACEARAGNFTRAHQIQEHLSQHDEDRAARSRHIEAMRSLRKHKPLQDHHVSHALVA